jgi:hypothetical protein
MIVIFTVTIFAAIVSVITIRIGRHAALGVMMVRIQIFQ